MLIWLASWPRSGNTLTSLVLRDVFGVREIGRIVVNDLDIGKVPWQAPAAEPYELPAELRELRKPELLAALRERPEPYFIKTHRLAESKDAAMALYVVRDGRDASVSYAHLIGARGPLPPPERLAPGLRGPHKAEDRYRRLDWDERLMRLITRGIPAYGNWSRSVLRWRRRHAATAILRFEGLLDDPAGAVAAACAELGVALPEPTGKTAPFAELQASHPKFFRRGEVDSWRGEMSPRLEDRFWAVHGETMEALDYAR